MSVPHFSSPFCTIHSSRTLRVSGQAQQILHDGFFSSGAAASKGVAVTVFADD